MSFCTGKYKVGDMVTTSLGLLEGRNGTIVEIDDTNAYPYKIQWVSGKLGASPEDKIILLQSGDEIRAAVDDEHEAIQNWLKKVI
jgi:hypothetical protein